MVLVHDPSRRRSLLCALTNKRDPLPLPVLVLDPYHAPSHRKQPTSPLLVSLFSPYTLSSAVHRAILADPSQGPPRMLCLRDKKMLQQLLRRCSLKPSLPTTLLPSSLPL